MTFHPNEREPALLTPHELLLSRLPGLLSLWTDDRERGRDAYQTARELVAAWAGLQRLVLPEHSSDILRRADEVIHDDMSRFLDAMLSHDFNFESWHRVMDDLDTDWDSNCLEADELEWRTSQAFEALDRTELFAWFAVANSPSDKRIHSWLESLPEQCERAEQFVAERPDLFLCLATDLAATIAWSRPGLEASAPQLWESLGKHRRIEEAREEIELIPSRETVLAGISRAANRTTKSTLLASNVTAALAIDKVKKKPPVSESSQLTSTEPKFKVGDLVSARSNPGILLPVIEVIPGGAEQRYRVFENIVKVTYYESQLQATTVPSEEQRVLTVRELQARLTSLHILSPSTANLFSLRSGRVHFVPYQYRPVLKLIRADLPRLLIADEVGVGKTIEAGLIIKELRARMDISSVLVICPKALVAERKWYNEMKRFDEQFTALDGPLLRHCLQESHVEGEWPEQYARAILPFSLFDSDLVFGKNGRGRRAKSNSTGLLTLDPPPKFDLVIVDEAHHIRNSTTLLHHGVRYFCDNAHAVVMLTATPVQLGSQDLFTLLNVLRSDLIIDRPSFEQMAEPNKFISAAVQHCRGAGPDWQRETITCLDAAANTSWGDLFIRKSPVFENAYQQLHKVSLGDSERVGLTRTVEELYTFSPFINRTRRRDIGAFTTRKPETLTVDFTAAQKSLHDGVLSVIERILVRCHGQQNVKFMMTTIRRQAASCLYGLNPMLADILMGKLDRLELLEASDNDDEADLGFVSQVRSEVEGLLEQAAQLSPADPKVNAFVKVLLDNSKRQNNKALVFSTFRHTLSYLMRHTNSRGLRVGLIHGDVNDDERADLRRRFSLPKEDNNAIDVLLSSEVGCEGLDFQFCDFLVNYDLPWNPMRIEQRIGRIDRYGQQSETIAIVNLITPGTVDADIYDRCLSRIGVFQQALGGSEEILGKITQELHDIAESFSLNQEERNLRLQQLADNGIRLIREEQELETKQSEFFGLNVPNQAWRDEIQSTETFWLSAAAIQGCVAAYLAHRSSSDGEHLLGDKSLKTLRLNQETRGRLLEDYKRLQRSNDMVSRAWEKWLKGSLPTLPVTFEQTTAVENPKAVYLSVVHPIVQQAARFLEITEPAYATLAAASATIPRGTHFFAVYRWEKEGVKPDESLVPVADDVQIEDALFNLLQTARDNGSANLPTAVECDALDHRHHLKWSEARAKHVADNRLLVEHRVQSLNISHRARRKAIEDQILRATNEKIRSMKESELARADADFNRRFADLQRATGSGDIRSTPVLFGTITISTESLI
jgi:SNF2 family DNA or RNA helicase